MLILYNLYAFFIFSVFAASRLNLSSSDFTHLLHEKVYYARQILKHLDIYKNEEMKNKIMESLLLSCFVNARACMHVNVPTDDTCIAIRHMQLHQCKPSEISVKQDLKLN